MIIQHNISALNSYNKLAGNNKALAKNLEKLSSGYKINRAADDAAGLGISEKMRAQITGMNRAQQNSKDGISLVQTAEGALTEVHSMLNRMVDLTTQASNGVYTNDEKTKIKDELAQLESEIDRIADATNFNGIKLLDGSLSGSGATKAVSSITTDLTTTKIDAVAGKYVMSSAAAGTTTELDNVGAKGTYTIALEDGTSINVDIKVINDPDDSTKVCLAVNGEKYGGSDTTIGNVVTAQKTAEAVKSVLDKELADRYTVSVDTAGKFTFEAVEKGTSTPAITGVSYKGQTSAGAIKAGASGLDTTNSKEAANAKTGIAHTVIAAKDFTGTNEKDAVFEINGQKFVVAAAGVDASKLSDSGIRVITATVASDQTKIAQQLSHALGMNVTYSTDMKGDGSNTAGYVFGAGEGKAGSGGLRLQIGETNDSFNQLDVTVDDCHAAALGVAGLNIDTPDAASASMMKAKAAIEQVSKTRSLLGATQNRLDHTLANLEETTTNLTEAESRIRDTDMANEMMKYTKNNILIQSSQAMLAQANQVPQGVLQLLQ